MNILDTLTLKWKLGLGFALPMVLIIALSTIVYSSLGSLIESMR